jgi:hypothetical protein
MVSSEWRIVSGSGCNSWLEFAPGKEQKQRARGISSCSLPLFIEKKTVRAKAVNTLLYHHRTHRGKIKIIAMQ